MEQDKYIFEEVKYFEFLTVKIYERQIIIKC